MIKQVITVFFLLAIGATAGFGGKYVYQWTTAPNIVEHGDYSEFYLSANAPKVIMYGTDWCEYCSKTRKLLAQYSIDYMDFDIEHSEIAKQQYQLLKGKGIPLLLIGNTRINGFRTNEILETLKIQKLIFE